MEIVYALVIIIISILMMIIGGGYRDSLAGILGTLVFLLGIIWVMLSCDEPKRRD